MPAYGPSGLAFWSQWVVANALGELAGLGIVGAIGYSIIHAFGEPKSVGDVLAFAVLAIGLGALEGNSDPYQFRTSGNRRPPAGQGNIGLRGLRA